VGAFGTAGCFSFYPTKNMHSLEGGMITTADGELARTLRLLRNQGMEQRYANEVVGANMRLTDVAAAVGREQLKKLDGWTEQRRSNAAVLNDGLKGVVTPPEAEGARHVYHQYTIRVADGRDELQAGLKEHGIGSAVYYPTPIHLLKPYRPGFTGLHHQAATGNRDWDLPQTMRAADEVLSLPVFPGLSDAELQRIIDAVNEVAGR
jgi:dTDP-4-amino-4,6-dideoxygalactose transaminase